MPGYIAYVPLKTQDGQQIAIAAAAPTVGAAIRDAASQVNAAVAASTGYPKSENGETLLVTIVFEVPEGVQQARHEIDGDNFRVFGVPAEGDEFPLRAIFLGAIDPIKSVDGRITF